MLPFIAASVGTYLGLHFPVLVLLPITLLGGGTAIVYAWLSGASVLAGGVEVLIPIFICQAGYMLGLTARETYGQLLARLNIGQSKRV